MRRGGGVGGAGLRKDREEERAKILNCDRVRKECSNKSEVDDIKRETRERGGNAVTP